jgi:anti-sigma B factor antagonist
LNFLLETVDDVKVLRLKEQRLDSVVAPDLKAQILVLLSDDPDAKIIIDLGETVYADSSGLGSLLFGLRQARDQGAKFAICGAQERIKSLIQIAQLGDVLTNYEDEYQAIAHLKG